MALPVADAHPMLRRFIYRLLTPVLRQLLRRDPITDPWERVDAAFPLKLLGPAARYDFDWYFEGESTVPVGSVYELRSWLRGCRYISDAALFHERDYWQHPRTFEQLKRGDCEDFALWAWRKLVELGIDADLVVGRREPPTTPGSGHAWIIFRRDGATYVMEPTNARHESWIRPLDEVRDRYEPHFGITAARERYTFAGWLLRELGLAQPRIGDGRLARTQGLIPRHSSVGEPCTSATSDAILMERTKSRRFGRKTPSRAERHRMLNLDLSASEQAILREVLEEAISDLGMEISATDSKDFRDDLKDRREVLQKVIAALGGGPGGTV